MLGAQLESTRDVIAEVDLSDFVAKPPLAGFAGVPQFGGHSGHLHRCLELVQLYNCQLMNFGLSRITEHNKNEVTDHLYDPLRQTLRKSSVSRGKPLSKTSSIQDLHGSKVSKRLREISPEQAEMLQRQILIPSEKRLKPTDHLIRVEGKQFCAIDVQQRKGVPMTQSEFKNVYKGEIVHQTVYQVGSSNNSKINSPKAPQYRQESLRGSPNQKMRRSSRSRSRGISRISDSRNRLSSGNAEQYGVNGQKQLRNSRDRLQTVEAETGESKYDTRATYVGVRDTMVSDDEGKNIRKYQSGDLNETNGGQQANLEIRNSESQYLYYKNGGQADQRISSNSEYGRISNDLKSGPGARISRQGSKEYSSRETYQRKKGPGRIGSGGILYGETYFSDERHNDESGQYEPVLERNLRGGSGAYGNYRESSEQYAKRGERLQNGGVRNIEGDRTSKRDSQNGRQKSTSKYNLFSCMDEAVNTKFKSFGKTELVASKPEVPPWS